MIAIVCLAVALASGPQSKQTKVQGPQTIQLARLSSLQPSFVARKENGKVYVYNIQKPFERVIDSVADQLKGWVRREDAEGVFFNRNNDTSVITTMVSVGRRKLNPDFRLVKGTEKDWTYVSIAEVKLVRL